MRLSRGTETLLGLAVAAALAAAALAVRGRPASPSEPPDVSRADATIDLGDARVTVSAGPRPILAFARNRFRFRAEKDGAAVPLGDAVVRFAMSMPMGDHRHPLAVAGDGWHEAVAALPLCPSGNRRWFGTLDFALDGRPRSLRFAFDLEPPPAPPGEGAPRP